MTEPEEYERTSVRLPKRLIDRVKEVARRERRTLSGEIAYLLERALAAESPSEKEGS